MDTEQTASYCSPFFRHNRSFPATVTGSTNPTPMVLFLFRRLPSTLTPVCERVESCGRVWVRHGAYDLLRNDVL